MIKLQFSHITKTGGSSLELSAKECGILWGLHNRVLWKSVSLKAKTKHKELWHIPLSFCEDEDLDELLKRYTFFTTVRNPYSRAVSEYYCLFGGRNDFEKQKIRSNDVNVFNRHFGYGFRKVMKRLKNPSILHNVTHWQHQHRYIQKNGRTIIQPENIIKYEEYDKQLMALFNKHELSIKKVKHNVSSQMCPHKFNVNHLSKENISLINEAYYEDFLLLGYDMK